MQIASNKDPRQQPTARSSGRLTARRSSILLLASIAVASLFPVNSCGVAPPFDARWRAYARKLSKRRAESKIAAGRLFSGSSDSRSISVSPYFVSSRLSQPHMGHMEMRRRAWGQ